MSQTTHVEIAQAELPDLSLIDDLTYVGGNIEYRFRDSLVAFDKYEDNTWTASIWPLAGDGRTEALGLAERFRQAGVYAWAYLEDSDEPFDPAFGPRSPLVTEG